MIDRPSIAEIREAAGRLRGVTVRTPLVPLHEAPHVLLKVETLQPVHSFKIRGVFHAVASMAPEVRARGLSTVSAGNTAQALAWAGRHFGVPVRTLMPETAPATKIEAVRRYGAEPVLVPVGELFRFLETRGWEREPYAFVHPWTDHELHVGHGTLGLELWEDRPDIQTVYVPVGGGGLLAGVGSAVRALAPTARIVGVEPASCAALHESLRQGRPARVDCRTMCDGVAVPYITEEMFPLLRDLADEVVLVSEDAVRAAIRRLALGDRLVVEGAGALAVAAALSAPAGVLGPSVALVTGGSIDPARLVEILADAGPLGEPTRASATDTS